MDIKRLTRVDDVTWRMEPEGAMRVPALIFGSRELVRDMDEMVGKQLANVASLPGIVGAACAMPDAHWGYGFPIGGVAAFDPAHDGVVSAGGVGFDIACGVRTLLTDLEAEDARLRARELADALFRAIPAGVGSTGSLRLSEEELDRMLIGGAGWAVSQGYGDGADLTRVEEGGMMRGAKPEHVSAQAKKRQRDEVGTLGSGNHYLEVQEIAEVYDADAADAFGLARGRVVISIHCGSRGLGHQIGTDYLQKMVKAAPGFGIALPDKELACAPAASELGQAYLGAMRAGINCALANRQVLTHLAREAVAGVFPGASLPLLFDVSHNTCKEERHPLGRAERSLLVHRKGATRAFGPNHPDLPVAFRASGQPVIVGGSMGTSSFILAGMPAGAEHAFASACHGAGRAMSRHQASRVKSGVQVVKELGERGIVIRSPSFRGVAEEAPYAYKDSLEVVRATQQAGLARMVARLEPIACVKG